MQQDSYARRATRRVQERGQATLLVVMGVGMTVLCGMGLMFDVSIMYAQRQLAQNAADSAALAAMSSIFNGTNANNSTFNNTFGNVPTGGGNPSRLNCSSNDHHTPCYYSRQNGFDPVYGDTVYVDFWNLTNARTQEPGVSFSSNANTPVPLLRVTVIRPVRTTLMSILTGGTSTRIAAQASAGIVYTNSTVPILVLHPTLTSSLSLSGNPNITICGGPSKSIQINSCAGTGGSIGGVRCQSSPALSLGGSSSIDLSKAGPLDSGGCTTGTGGNLGNFGYPKTRPGGLSLGSAGRYIDPSSVIPDPLANVAAPTTTVPETLTAQNNSTACSENAGKSTCTDGQTTSCSVPNCHNVLCPTTDVFGNSVSSCTVLKPGVYSSGGPLSNVKNDFVILTPGIYYVQSGGLGFAANGGGQTETPPPVPGPSAYPACNNPDPCTGCGVLMYLSSGGGSLSVDANAGKKQGIALLGSDPSTSCTAGASSYNYKGMVFFVDHAAPAQSHSFGGGGNWNLTGTVYMTNTVSTILSSTSQNQYQSLSLQGNSASGTVTGQIIADALSMSGTPNIQMNLVSNAQQQVPSIALVH